MTKLAHIADRVLNRPLMIHPDKLSLIASILDGRIGIDAVDLRRVDPDDAEAAAMRGEAYHQLRPDASRYVGQFEAADPNDPKAGRKPYRTTDRGVAIIPVIGSLVNRGSWMDAMSGVTSYEKFKYQIGAAAADKSVASILLDMDSPGGEAVGAFEAGDAVRDAAAVKPVVAVVNGMAASAAYAIASAATKIVTTQSGISGSIGVVMLHADYSVAIANRGIKPTFIHAGARKIDGNAYQPLTDDVKAELSAEINRFYDLFVSGVAKGRTGMTEKAIRATEARTYIGADAVKVGLADAVGSFESALSDLTSKAPRRQNQPKKGMLQMEAVFTSEQLGAAILRAQAAERDRIRAITSLPEATGREAHALKLALSGDVSVEEAKATLLAGDAKGDATSQSAMMWDRAMKQRGMVLEGDTPKTSTSAAGNSTSSAPDWGSVLRSRGMGVA